METETKEDDRDDIRDASKSFENIIEVSSIIILSCIVLYVNHTSFYFSSSLP